jgi:hypothetical protein
MTTRQHRVYNRLWCPKPQSTNTPFLTCRVQYNSKSFTCRPFQYTRTTRLARAAAEGKG